MTEVEKQAIEILKDDEMYITDSFYREFRTTIADKYTKAFETVLDLIEKQQAEIDKYKEMYAVSVADRVNSAFKQEHKNNEDLEMLYKGCQIELEKKDKIIDKYISYIWTYDLNESKEWIKNYIENEWEEK